MAESALDTLLGPLPSTAAEWNVTQNAAQALATALGADETLREKAGPQICARVVALLEKDTVTTDACIQLLRVLGNLCVGEQDNNRQLLLDEGVCRALATVLARPQNVQQARAGVAAALNLSMDYVPASAVYVSSGLYDALLHLLWPGAISQKAADAMLVEQVFGWALQIVEDILTNKCPLSPVLLQKTVATLCSIILTSSAQNAASKSVDSLTTSAELLEALTLDEDAAPGAFLAAQGPPLQLLEHICDFISTSHPRPEYTERDAASYGNVKAALCKVLTAAAADKAVMEAAFAEKDHRLIKVLVRWVQEGRGESDRSDLLITASIALGNLARKDENCIALVQQYDLAKIAASLLQDRTSHRRERSKGKPGENTHILHGLLGLLKHLAIPPANKSVLGQAGVVAPALSVLKSSFDVVQPVQHGAIGLLKHLCAGNVANTLQILADGGLEALDELIGRSDDFRLRSEATRVLANAIRAVWASQPAADASTDSAKRQLAASAKTASALAEMLRLSDKYPILINESIVSLTLLATLPEGAINVLTALVAEKEVAPVAPSAIPAHVNGNSYQPSPVSAAPMPFSQNAADGQHVVATRSAKGSAPSRSASGSTSSLKPSSAAQALANVVRQTGSVPKEVAVNACALLGLVGAGDGNASDKRRLIEVSQASLRSAQVADNKPDLAQAAEQAMGRLQLT